MLTNYKYEPENAEFYNKRVCINFVADTKMYVRFNLSCNFNIYFCDYV